MKNSSIIITMVAYLAAMVMFISCSKKDDPRPASANKTASAPGDGNDGDPVFEIPGDPGTVKGYFVLNKKNTDVAGTVVSSVRHVYSAANIDPASSYPVFSISFPVKPVRDSTYAIDYNNILTVATSQSQSDQYFVTPGTGAVIVVDVSGNMVKATVKNVRLSASGGKSAFVSGSVTAYY
jgi:hypothetical protein